MVPIYIVKTARTWQFCDFYRQSPKKYKLQNEKKIYKNMQETNGLEKKIGWNKLVAKTSEPEIEQ